MLEDDVAELLRDVTIVAIGPVTKREIEKRGLKVHVVPARATIEDMVNSIIEYFTSPQNGCHT